MDAAAWPDARLLIVDDQTVNIRVLERLLENEGYTHVRSTTKPAEVLALCDELQPDLLLLDLRMPGMDGYAVLEQLGRALPPDAYLPVLVLTADDTEEAQRRALALGADDLLTKPFDHLEVGLRIRNLLRTRRLHLQLREHNAQLAEEVRAQTRELQERMAAVERAHAESRAILDATSDAMLLVGEDGRVRSTNRQFGILFGLDPDGVGRWGDEVSGYIRRTLADPDRFLARSERWMAEPEGRFEIDVEQQWPVERTLEVASAPVPGVGRLFTFADVTRERAVDRMKSEFVALVSHELRTPLTSITGYLELVLGGEVGEVTEEQRAFLDIVRSNADRLKALINELLDVSRIESGKVELRRGPVDVARLIGDVASSLRPQIAKKQQSLRLELPEGLPVISADADRLVQVLTNLLSNAHKYTPEGGQITCAASIGPESVRIEVRDTGIGMTQGEQAQLFTRFFRARNRATQEVSGTGLGLTIAKSLAEMHGGAIEVASIPGRGSTFSMVLPLPRVPMGVPHEPGPPSLVSARGRVLVVEDDIDIARLLERFLVRGGYDVLVAHDGASGLRLAEIERPDLVALDLELPDTDGFAVLAQLGRSEATAGIPVLIVSSMPDEGRGQLLGAVGYFTKPVAGDRLLEHVGRIIAGGRASLVVLAGEDDDERRRVARQLGRAGHRVVGVRTAREAVDVARREPPGLVLVDAGPSRAPDPAALRALRADVATRDVPVVVMVNRADVAETDGATADVWRSCALECKPCGAEELAGAIARSLGARGRPPESAALAM